MRLVRLALASLVGVTFLAAWPAEIAAVPPWIPFRRIEADPRKQYRLSEADGPYVILAASFAGQGAPKEAQQLVLELRRRYKLRAFTHTKHYKDPKTVLGRGIDEFGQTRRMRYAQRSEFDEIAVLVGSFESVDDPAAQKALKKIKRAWPKCLESVRGKRTTLRLAGWRQLQKRLNTDQDKKNKGPLGMAFMTKNPLLPKGYFARQGIDRLVLQMNTGVRHSLLDCQGEYTVRVATFRGSVIIDQQKIKELAKGGRMKSQLGRAAENAHRLTKALRKKGVEAYEFHDRQESIVTVGSFESVGPIRPDGKMEISDPAVVRTVETYAARPGPLPGTIGAMAKSPVPGISFDIRPWPIKVPHRSIPANNGRNRLLR